MTAYFDRYRDSYSRQVEAAIPFASVRHDVFTRRKAEILVDLIRESSGPRPGARVLDIGCGPGLIHPLLLSPNTTLHAADMALQLLQRARSENPNVGYFVYDGKRLPFARDRYDVVFAICVLHHVPPEDWGAFLKELARVLAPGGLAAIFEHNPLNPLTRWIVNRCEFDEDAVLLGAGRLSRLLRSAGLTEPITRYFLTTPFGSPSFRRLDDIVCRLPLGAQYYVAARKPG